jgi:hypothetical protein
MRYKQVPLFRAAFCSTAFLQNDSCIFVDVSSMKGRSRTLSKIVIGERAGGTKLRAEVFRAIVQSRI